MIRTQRRPPSRPLRQFVVVLLVCALAGAVAGGVAGVIDPGGDWPFVAVAVLVTAFGIGFAACIWWWSRLDEAAREAHKWAWWWGGSAGMALGGVVLLSVVSVMRDGRVPAPLAAMAPDDLLYVGALGMILCQVLGYTVAWIAWWLRRR